MSFAAQCFPAITLLFWQCVSAVVASMHIGTHIHMYRCSIQRKCMCIQEYVCMHRCSIQRNHDQQLIALGSKHNSAAADSTSLEVPQPDVIPKCKAMIGFCQAMAVWMSCTAAIIQRLANLNQKAPAADQKKLRLAAEASPPTMCLLVRAVHPPLPWRGAPQTYGHALATHTNLHQ